jgi:hypothetical protein
MGRLARLPSAKPRSCLIDLLALPFLTWALGLVVPTEQKNHAVAMCMAEHPKEDLLWRQLLALTVANFTRALAEPKLEQPLTKLPAELTRTHGWTKLLEKFPHRGPEDLPLGQAQTSEPLKHHLPPVVVDVELDRKMARSRWARDRTLTAHRALDHGATRRVPLPYGTHAPLPLVSARHVYPLRQSLLGWPGSHCWKQKA